MLAAEWFVILLSVYAAFGLLFAVVFLTAGIGHIDPVAKQSGAGFRIIIAPGVAALWPLLLLRWIRGGREI